MANLIQIDNLIADYSENLLPSPAVFDENTDIFYSGSGTVSLASNVSYDGAKSVNLFCNTDAFVVSTVLFNFNNDIKKVVTKTGNYIFSLKLYNGTVSTNSLNVTVKVNLYVNTVFVDSFTNTFDTGTFSRNSWTTFAQSFALNANDEVNFTFEFDAPTSPEPNPNVNLYFDGLKLEHDDRSLGIPTIYSLPVSKNNIPSTLVLVSELGDLPVPIASVITLKANTSYYFTKKVDLLANRIVFSAGSVIRGTSSLNAGIQNGGIPLITSTGSVAINDISIENNGQVFNVNSNASTDNVFINDTSFFGCTTLGDVTNVASIIFSSCSLINCGTLNLATSGTIGTFGVQNSACVPINTINQFTIPATATIARRIRVTNTSFTLDNVAAAFNISASATIPDEKWILSLCNFIGTSANYFDGGINHTSNKSLFLNNTGITNTTVSGQAFMQANATATVIAAPSTFVKALGTTTAGTLSRYLMPVSNRLTCDAAIRRTLLVVCQISFTSSNNQNVEFGFFDSTLGTIITASRIIQNTGGAGIPQAIAIFAEISHIQGDYIELHVANNTSATNVTVVSMNYIITEV